MANELQWSATQVKDEREKAINALKEHKARTKNVKTTAYRVDKKTTILLKDGLSKKEINKRLKKYQNE